jgi:hypothetical protein
VIEVDLSLPGARVVALHLKRFFRTPDANFNLLSIRARAALLLAAVGTQRARTSGA